MIPLLLAGPEQGSPSASWQFNLICSDMQDRMRGPDKGKLHTDTFALRYSLVPPRVICMVLT